MSKKIGKKLFVIIISILIMLLTVVSCTIPEESSANNSKNTGDDNQENTLNISDENSLDRAVKSDKSEYTIGAFRLSWLSVKNKWSVINPKDFGSYIIAGVQTYNESDPVVIRIDSTYSEASISLCEDKSKDTETSHTDEEVGVLQIVPNNKTGLIKDINNNTIGEVQSISIKQSSKDKIFTLSYKIPGGKYKNPVVIGAVVTYNNSEPACVRIHSVSQTSFKYSLDEWEYNNGYHPEEKINFVIMEKGTHCLGYKSSNSYYYVAEVGKKTISKHTPTKTGSPYRERLLTDFGKSPYIFGALQTNDFSKPFATTVAYNSSCSSDSFYVRLQHSEKLMEDNTSHEKETYGYIAIGKVGPKTTSKSKVVSNNGALQVKNNKLCNKNGTAIQLEGMSTFWINWDEGGKFANPEVIDWLVRDWKIDVYRIAMGVNPYDGREVIIKTDARGSLSKVDNTNCGKPCENQGLCYIGHETIVKEKVETLVDACIKRGIYVIIDWHVHDALMNQKSAYNFFLYMAKKYKDVPNVIFEIWNEPSMKNNDTKTAKKNDYGKYIYQWESDIKPYCEWIIRTIRNTGNNNIIICPTPNFDQQLYDAYDSPIDSKFNKNVMYSVHFYAGTTDFWADYLTGNNLTYKIHHPFDSGSSLYYLLKIYKLPVFVSEWGTSQFDGGQDPGRYCGKSESNLYLTRLSDYKISWCNWAISDKDEVSAILKPGSSPIGFWSSYALSTSGAYIRGKIRD